MAQQKPSWKTSSDPEWRTRRPMTVNEAKQITAKNIKEAKAGGFKGDLTIKTNPKPTMEEAKAALKKAAKEAGMAAREELRRMQMREDIKAGEQMRKAEMERLQARRAGGEAARRAGYEVSEKFTPRETKSVNTPRSFTKFEKLQATVDKYFPEPSRAQTRVMNARRVAGSLGAAMAAMGGAGMADEGWAAGMASGGGKGGYQPAVRKRTSYSTREQ